MKDNIKQVKGHLLFIRKCYHENQVLIFVYGGSIASSKLVHHIIVLFVNRVSYLETVV